MDAVTSPTQKKRVEKAERMRRFFGKDDPRIYEWTASDEALDFAVMSDDQITQYLKRQANGKLPEHHTSGGGGPLIP